MEIIRKTLFKIPFYKKLHSKFFLYLDSRESKKLELDDNILDYSFCEESQINNIVVKDPNCKIPNTLWGAPVSVFVYEDIKDNSLYRNGKVKKHLYTTKGNKLAEALFIFAGWTDVVIKIDKQIKPWTTYLFERLRKEILELDKKHQKINAMEQNGKR